MTKVVESGKSGEPIGTSNYAARLKELTDKGYEVVTDEFAGPKTSTMMIRRIKPSQSLFVKVQRRLRPS